MTTELFKQWKRDELPHLQDYYIKNNFGQTVIARNYKYQNNKLNVLFALDSFMYKNHHREGLRCFDNPADLKKFCKTVENLEN